MATTDQAAARWPAKLFRLRGFAHAEIRYSGADDSLFVSLRRNADDVPIVVYLPHDYLSMTIFDLRKWVDAEVEKIGDTSPSEMNPDPAYG